MCHLPHFPEHLLRCCHWHATWWPLPTRQLHTITTCSSITEKSLQSQRLNGLWNPNYVITLLISPQLNNLHSQLFDRPVLPLTHFRNVQTEVFFKASCSSAGLSSTNPKQSVFGCVTEQYKATTAGSKTSSSGQSNPGLGPFLGIMCLKVVSTVYSPWEATGSNTIVT